MKRIYLLFIFIIGHCIVAQATKPQKISNPNITLKQIFAEDNIDKDIIMNINDSFQSKEITKQCKDGIEPNYQEVCLHAFSQWCNNFVNEEREYIVFRLPLLKDVNLSDYNWKSGESPNNDFVYKKKTKIILDPFIKDIPINNYLQQGNVIISISMPAGGFSGLRIVVIKAIIPYQGEYYKYEHNYVFELTVDFMKFKTKDTDKISILLGKQITDNPNYFIDRDGILSDNFLIQNFKWEYFIQNSTYRIKKIDINPAKNKLFLYDLIYGFELR